MYENKHKHIDNVFLDTKMFFFMCIYVGPEGGTIDLFLESSLAGKEQLIGGQCLKVQGFEKTPKAVKEALKSKKEASLFLCLFFSKS